MAKNNLVKWIVGASSVLAFTGFIGMAKEFDASQTKAAASDGTVKDETYKFMEDPVKDEFFGLDSSKIYQDGELYEYKEKHQHDDDHDDDDDEDDDDDRKYSKKDKKGSYIQDRNDKESSGKSRSRAS